MPHLPSETETPARLQGDGWTGEMPVPGEGGEMAFLDHLEELRWSLFKGLGAIIVAIIACAFFSDWIVREILLGPTDPDFFMYHVLGIDAQPIQLLNRTITGQFFADIGIIVAVGVVVGSPIFIYYLWQFVEPALYPHEKQGLRFASAFASFSFLCGIAFGYLILTPLALQFFESYTLSEQIVNYFDITKYFGMVTRWTLASGVLFELPVAIYFLTKLGIVTPSMLRTYRRIAVVIIFIVAAIVTPPDPISQLIVATPLLLLYELSILISAFTLRRRRKALAKQEAGVDEE